MPHFMTITKVYRTGIYDGIFPGFALTTSSVKHEVGIKESDIVDRAYTANMLYVGRPEHEVAATFHVTRLRRARTVGSTRNSTNYQAAEDLGYFLHQERIAHPYEYQQQQAAAGGAVMNFGPAFAYTYSNNNNNGAATYAVPASQLEDPQSLNIVNNENPISYKGGRRRRRTKQHSRRVRRTRAHK